MTTLFILGQYIAKEDKSPCEIRFDCLKGRITGLKETAQTIYSVYSITKERIY